MTEEEPELYEETRRILEERLATLDEDAKHAVDAHDALRDIRAKLKYTPPK